jgi:hypothetical protein
MELTVFIGSRKSIQFKVSGMVIWLVFFKKWVSMSISWISVSQTYSDLLIEPYLIITWSSIERRQSPSWKRPIQRSGRHSLMLTLQLQLVSESEDPPPPPF